MVRTCGEIDRGRCSNETMEAQSEGTPKDRTKTEVTWLYRKTRRRQEYRGWKHKTGERRELKLDVLTLNRDKAEEEA